MSWVVLALAGGSFQTARNALARSLAHRMSPLLVSWARFAFNLPLSTTVVVTLTALHGWPRLSPVFLGYCAVTGVTQLLANVALVAAFRRSNFAQAIVFHKLEVTFTALVGVLLFAERPSVYGWAGLVISAIGILAMNLGRESAGAGWRRAFHFDVGAMLSILCALLIVAASFALKLANGEYVRMNPRVGSGRFEAAAATLFHTTWIEVLLLTTAIAFFWPREFRHVRPHWRRMALIGSVGFAGSLCWFWAFSLTLVAYVKTVGQIEVVLAVLIAIVVFRERDVWKQLPGVLLVLGGIVLVLVAG